MERRFLITLTGLTLPIIMGLSPVASAQTPEPAAGNPAINSTPTPSNSSGSDHGFAVERGGNPERLEPRFRQRQHGRGQRRDAVARR